jgi:hypothetical protein
VRTLVVAVVVVACDAGPPKPAAPEPVVPIVRDAQSPDRCLPVLDCGDCPGPCTAGADVRPFLRGTPVTIRTFCVGATCTDVWDPHHPCKDICRPPTTIDTTCHFDAQHRCVSAH